MRLAVLAGTAAVLAVLCTPALGASTAPAPLVCDRETHWVDGFGRGQVLHVVDSTREFVVTRAEAGGAVLFDNPGLAARADVVACTTASPTSGRALLLHGFFTPRG